MGGRPGDRCADFVTHLTVTFSWHGHHITTHHVYPWGLQIVLDRSMPQIQHGLIGLAAGLIAMDLGEDRLALGELPHPVADQLQAAVDGGNFRLGDAQNFPQGRQQAHPIRSVRVNRAELLVRIARVKTKITARKQGAAESDANIDTHQPRPT